MKKKKKKRKKKRNNQKKKYCTGKTAEINTVGWLIKHDDRREGAQGSMISDRGKLRQRHYNLPKQRTQ